MLLGMVTLITVTQVISITRARHITSVATIGCVNLSFAFVEGESLLMGLKDIALSSGRYGHY